MFYETARNDHGLPRDPFKAIVSPRPVGWITAMSAAGDINLAPYSFFNAVSDDPPIVMFSSDGYKDSLTFIAETREFVCNLATFALRAAMVATSETFARGVNEMAQAGLAPRRPVWSGRHGWRPRRARWSARSCRSSISPTSTDSR